LCARQFLDAHVVRFNVLVMLNSRRPLRPHVTAQGMPRRRETLEIDL
jgi:hypothetical protein